MLYTVTVYILIISLLMPTSSLKPVPWEDLALGIFRLQANHRQARDSNTQQGYSVFFCSWVVKDLLHPPYGPPNLG